MLWYCLFSHFLICINFHISLHWVCLKFWISCPIVFCRIGRQNYGRLKLIFYSKGRENESQLRIIIVDKNFETFQLWSYLCCCLSFVVFLNLILSLLFFHVYRNKNECYAWGFIFPQHSNDFTCNKTLLRLNPNM